MIYVLTTQLPLQILVSPIAKGGIAGVFAQAKGYGFGFSHFKGQGLKVCAFVGTVAEGLIFRQATATPVVGAGFQGEDGGFFIDDGGFRHDVFSSEIGGYAASSSTVVTVSDWVGNVK